MTDEKKIQSQIQKLCKEINDHNRRYYDEGRETISDFEYDMLLNRLNELAAQYPHLVPEDAPINRVGGEPTKEFPSFTHRIPMKSLGNTYNKNELVEFDRRVKRALGTTEEVAYTVELKIDGVSISVHYEQGTLTHGVTRGNGIVGDDITPNIKTISSIPTQLKKPFTFEARGEIYMQTSAFKKMNAYREKQGEKLFANPRNATAGSLKLLNPQEVARRPLQAFFYALPWVSEDTKQQCEPIETHLNGYHFIKYQGLPVSEDIELCETIHTVLEHIEQWQTKRNELDFEIDGMVVKVNRLDYQTKLGYTAKEPRWAIAYKFPANRVTTVLKEISISMGRTGTLTPVAELKPVLLSGTTVKRASLHNFDEIYRKDIREGDTVWIEKSGEIIPYVVSVVTENRTNDSIPFPIPTHCPVCNEPIVKDEEEVALRCVNLACPSLRYKSIEHFASKAAMDIDGMGEKVVQRFVDLGFLKDFSDLYRLDYRSIQTLEGFGEKSALRLKEAIEESRMRPLQRLIFALGIRHVGTKGARLLAQHFGSLDALMKASVDEITSIYEVGDVMAESIVNFFQLESNQQVIQRLRESQVNFEVLSEERKVFGESGHFFSGKKVVLTGELERYTRSDASKLIAERGGEVTSSVSGKTDLIIAGSNAGSKYEKAKKLGIPILDEAGFLKQLEE